MQPPQDSGLQPQDSGLQPQDSDLQPEDSDLPPEAFPPEVFPPEADDDTAPIPAGTEAPPEPAGNDATARPSDPIPSPPADSALAHPVAGGQVDGASFTLALPLRGRRVLVIGGSESATAIVASLRDSGALIRVVAPTLSPTLTELAARGLIEVANRQYQARDLADAWLAFACSDHRSVNAALAFDAEQARVWCVTPEDVARPPPAESGAPLGRRALLLGGARSGKSATAEAMLADWAAVDYVATGQLPGHGDAEWDERIRRHQARRPGHWRTIETVDVASVLFEAEPSTAVLIDCLATWLSRTMDDCGLWAERDDAGKQFVARQDDLLRAWTTTTRRVVAVSNEVGSGVVPATESGRRFRDELGWLNTRMAAAADEVWLCTAGIPTRLR